MEFKIEDLEYALERYTNVVGEIEDKADRVNTNKRQAFINAFIGPADMYTLRDLFGIKDTMNQTAADKFTATAKQNKLIGSGATLDAWDAYAWGLPGG